jgi:hypothetical protein
MMRPPGGACSRMSRYAACAQWKAPSRFVATTSRHCSGVTREDHLLLNHRLARGIVQAHTDWLNKVEQELGSRSRR